MAGRDINRPSATGLSCNVEHVCPRSCVMLAMLLLYPLQLLFAADDPTELYSCSFAGHTPAGAVSGSCTTQSRPGPEYIARWEFTLTFDEQSSPTAGRITPDQFYDMVRSQCLEDGSFTTIIPLWGDFVIRPEDPDYVSSNKACSPVYQVSPSFITLLQINASPPTLRFVFEERPVDYVVATGLTTAEWTIHYLESFRRLQLNLSMRQFSSKSGRLK
ncbi:MAG: hypothetical protein QOJ99_777 [Bryobacterales bacterium]|nr:hypothetical protein [Bryobacterales bacterium]